VTTVINSTGSIPKYSSTNSTVVFFACAGRTTQSIAGSAEQRIVDAKNDDPLMCQEGCILRGTVVRIIKGRSAHQLSTYTSRGQAMGCVGGARPGERRPRRERSITLRHPSAGRRSQRVLERPAGDLRRLRPHPASGCKPPLEFFEQSVLSSLPPNLGHSDQDFLVEKRPLLDRARSDTIWKYLLEVETYYAKGSGDGCYNSFTDSR